MAKVTNKGKSNPQLKERELKDGRTALYLEYYLGRSEQPRLDADGNQMYYTTGKMAGKPMWIIKHERRKEELKLYLYTKPRNPQEKNHNTETLTLAQQVRNNRERELLSGTMGYKPSHKSDNVMSVFEAYLQRYQMKDIRNIRLALNRFKDYLRLQYPTCAIKKTAAEIKAIDEAWAESHKDIKGKHDINQNEYYRFTLKPSQFTDTMVGGFVEYLKRNSEGSGAATAYERFKKIVKCAVKDGYLNNNPCAEIVCKRNDAFCKDILSEAEIAKLLSTHYEKENPNIRRAFIFSLYTGIRFCDVKDMRYSHIDYPNKRLKFEQDKTKGHSEHSVVEMPLRDDLLRLIGTPDEYSKSKSDLIFDLPSHTMCLKALRRWTKRAGIDKHITWHCARHSFATNILENGANIKVVAELLGHSGLTYVTRYTRAIDESKKAAVNSLPTINL